MAPDSTGLVTLSEQECLRLLRTHPVAVGRLGVTDTDGHPIIIPANYRLDGDTVVVRTATGSVLAERAGGHKVAFEVDEIDPAWQEGWSVLIQGTAVRVSDEDELARLRRLPLHPWAPGERPVYLQIVPSVVTGRRIA